MAAPETVDVGHLRLVRRTPDLSRTPLVIIPKIVHATARENLDPLETAVIKLLGQD